MTDLISFICGTRPEFIKISPIVKVLRSCQNFNISLMHSGQHKELYHDAISSLQLEVDYIASFIEKSANLPDLCSQLFININKYLLSNKPFFVVVHGDTATTLIASICANQLGIKIIHIEAGRRSYNNNSPHPEEVNRRMVSILTQNHLITEDICRKNLLNEGFDNSSIFKIPSTLLPSIDHVLNLNTKNSVLSKNNIIVNFHRRENFGKNLNMLISQIQFLSKSFQKINFIFVTHPNPKLKGVVQNVFEKYKNVSVVDALPYKGFIDLISSSIGVITDSVGIVEECSLLNIAVLSCRESVENSLILTANCKNIPISNKEFDNEILEFVTKLSNIKIPKNKNLMCVDTQDFNSSIIEVFNKILLLH